MKAVWSYWSKPFEAYRHASWANVKNHLLAWVLSTMTVRRHYAKTALYTDDAGARLLIDGIGLEFDEVSTSLNALRDCDPGWWALGKLHTYRRQKEPFVHLDSDVFLWRPLPCDPDRVALLSQNPEYFTRGRSYYKPELVEDAIANVDGAWLPAEWRWYSTSGCAQRGDCCGVFGGNRIDFIQYYATQAIRLIETRRNQPAWQRLQNKDWHNHLFEQYLLSACIEYHSNRDGSPFRDIAMSYVFPSMEAAFDQDTATRVGYTHLIAEAKRNQQLADRVEARVAKDAPERYWCCMDYLEGRG